MTNKQSFAVRHYLTSSKDEEALRALLSGKHVRIWSGEHHAWWRPGRGGYTDQAERAGVYGFDEAWLCTKNCGPEKAIAYDPVDPPL